MTLLLQGLTLAAVLRWARLPDDGGELAEQHLADRTATEAASTALSAVAARLQIAHEVTDRVRAGYDERLADLTDPTEDTAGRSGEPTARVAARPASSTENSGTPCSPTNAPPSSDSATPA